MGGQTVRRSREVHKVSDVLARLGRGRGLTLKEIFGPMAVLSQREAVVRLMDRLVGSGHVRFVNDRYYRVEGAQPLDARVGAMKVTVKDPPGRTREPARVDSEAPCPAEEREAIVAYLKQVGEAVLTSMYAALGMDKKRLRNRLQDLRRHGAVLRLASGHYRLASAGKSAAAQVPRIPVHDPGDVAAEAQRTKIIKHLQRGPAWMADIRSMTSIPALVLKVRIDELCAAGVIVRAGHKGMGRYQLSGRNRTRPGNERRGDG